MDSKMMSIKPHETRITGKWVLESGELVADSTSKRIDNLIENDLLEIARSEDGWSILYIDKADGRFWELIYPASDQHGGGAPCLSAMSKDEAVTKYKISA